MQSLVFAVVLCLLLCCHGVAAQEVYTAEPWEGLADLVFDHSPPPSKPVRLQARQESSEAFPSATRVGDATGASASTSSAATSSATSDSPSSLPTPFDSSLGNNFTAPSCPAFFDTFMNNATFNHCRPLSLLLQTSNSFFQAQRSPVLLSQTLDAACNANFTACSALMSSLATDIKKDSNCGADLEMQNPMVQQAYNGFLAYDTLFQAGCLTGSEGDYCFSNAVSNASAPTSGYIYYLPLGVQLPAGTRPACNTCLRDTMQIYAQAAANNTLPVSDEYTDAAQMIDMTCGPSYTAEVTQHTNAASTAVPHPLGASSLILLASVLGYWIV